ncbi:uncharacterized protein F5891DRAFT_1207411 [Suillus fuscotomentosus]|uniref:Uncharacterized protein n=1 Tax=Suillus fuscotomentosus TaxID=1912939 RepID=A0AAD4HPU8_9AGAM|nr:uncharacterized protein F5891DRAFT_1207411 [Suillus fuscotomentosus]KAG1904407.1 hypothetical protein F5891DRAFT_1207411 [Suillus fuscotomentosus]
MVSSFALMSNQKLSLAGGLYKQRAEHINHSSNIPLAIANVDRHRAASAAVLDAKINKNTMDMPNGEPNALIQTNIVFFMRPVTEQVSWDPPACVCAIYLRTEGERGDVNIDRDYYTLGSVDDSHVLASLLKPWLRELWDILMPEEMYDD